MSAIVGLLYRDAHPVDPADLQRMVDRLAHRGPDGCGLWHAGPVGLGHRMLWTTPESLHERLPLVNRRGDLVITADARIDNRDELLPLVGLNDRPAPDVTDSEVILAAYETWGEACPEKLLGDFAFAIWDARRQKLFCARDHFGVKSFFYHVTDRLIAFATEIKALLTLPAIPATLNETKVAQYFVPETDDGASTFYAGIHRLPAAHCLTIAGHGVHVRRYWFLDPRREIRLRNNAEYAEALRELFVEAVRCRLRSAFPVGSTLSGGLDSSSIACVARSLLHEQGRGPLPTFSARYATLPQCDETPYQDAVLAQGGCDPHFWFGDETTPLTDIERMFWHLDGAFDAGNLSVLWEVARLAQSRGVRVLLDGFDGDTTISHGIGYLYELAQQRRWLKLARELRGYTRNVTGDPWDRALWAWIRKYALRPAIAQSPVLTSLAGLAQPLGLDTRTRQGVSNGTEWQRYLNPAFVQRTSMLAAFERVHLGPPITEREKHYRELIHPCMQSTLELNVGMEGAFSIEMRMPFCDRRLAEFCLALPPEQKMQDGIIRMVMRRAMEGILPPVVQWRPGKSNLYPYFQRALQKAMTEERNSIITNDMTLIADYVDVPTLRSFYEQFARREANVDETMAFWRALGLTLWLQRQYSMVRL